VTEVILLQLQNVSSRLASTQQELQEEKQLGGALAANEGNWQTKFKNLEKQFNDYQKEKDKVLSIKNLLSAKK